MIQAFLENPLVLLFFVIALGYGLGRINVGKFRFGVAMVLFVGLALGGLHKDLVIPEFMIFFGLSLFVYSVGLASGPSFFAALKSKAMLNVGFVFIMLTLTASLAFGLHYLMVLSAQDTAGLYAGSTTNTPALAGLIDLIGQKVNLASIERAQTEQAVASYSIAYPAGIIGTILAIFLLKKLLKIDFAREGRIYLTQDDIVNRSVEITNEEVTHKAIRDLRHEYGWTAIFGRLIREGNTELINWDTRLKLGDRVVIVGNREEVAELIGVVGRKLEKDLSTDETEYMSKRIFVSNPDLAGQKLSALNLSEKFSAIVTRIRRGDIDILARADTVLELGDMVQFVTRKQDLGRLSAYFGDSYESLSSINLFSLGLGLVGGLLLGMVNFELPGGVHFRLGYAGGPILMALILGALRRTGPIVWTMPLNANLSFQQLGLAILLGGVGVNSGHTFFSTIGQSSGLLILAAALVISFFSAAITLTTGYKILKIPFSILCGMVSHQPAILDYSIEQAGNKLPTIGFTLMLPIALIVKVLYVQILYLILS